MSEKVDIVVIGAGIAGAGFAAHASAGGEVVILEAEDQPGYHTTGRSAAAFVPNYGPPVIRALSGASEAFLRQPGTGYGDGSLLRRRGEMLIAAADQRSEVDAALELGFAEITVEEAVARVGVLRRDRLAYAAVDERAEDIDVDRLLQGYLRQAKANGARLHCGARVEAIARAGGGFEVTTGAGNWRCDIIVNAAGAWADQIAGLAGVDGLGIVPKRRSAALLEAPGAWAVDDWPLVFGAGETFYFRPMSGALMISPADETPVEPHDAWADDMALAEAMARLEEATTIPMTRPRHTWAGLRTFAPDGNPVVGHDARLPGLFWLAGQGGYGIQTSPALSRLAAGLALGARIPGEIERADALIAAMAPARFAAPGG